MQQLLYWYNKNKYQRMYQHDLNVRNKNVNHSALTEHLIKTGHEIDKNNFKTIYKENNYKRFFVESIFINNVPNTLNKQQDFKFAYFYQNTWKT